MAAETRHAGGTRPPQIVPCPVIDAGRDAQRAADARHSTGNARGTPGRSSERRRRTCSVLLWRAPAVPAPPAARAGRGGSACSWSWSARVVSAMMLSATSAAGPRSTSREPSLATSPERQTVSTSTRANARATGSRPAEVAHSWVSSGSISTRSRWPSFIQECRAGRRLHDASAPRRGCSPRALRPPRS